MTQSPLTAKQQERAAAVRANDLVHRGPKTAVTGDVAHMLVRRGFSPRSAALDLPFARDDEDRLAQPFCELLEHYGFRLFFRGAIAKPEGFLPPETTRYLDAQRACEFADKIVDLGMAERLSDGRYRLLKCPDSFGSTLEWFVGRTLRSKYHFDVVEDVKFGAAGVGGDLDLVAAGEGKLIYIELKSSPPKHLSVAEVGAFLDRVQALRPELAIFVMDTALRLSDKVLPMFESAADERQVHLRIKTIDHDVFALSPTVYIHNARPELLLNFGIALAQGLRELSPQPFALHR